LRTVFSKSFWVEFFGFRGEVKSVADQVIEYSNMRSAGAVRRALLTGNLLNRHW
jgi:hypothetical protein